MDLGPQLPGESGIRAKVRLHQSWYRAQVLGLPQWGQTPAPSNRPLGSILTIEDGDAGHGFVTTAAERLFHERRRQGWGVDPVRIPRYLTSSQGLTVNLLAPLREEPHWAARTFAELLEQPATVVRSVEIEYAPPRRSNHLGDMTRIDALLETTSKGDDVLVCVEVKLADRWSSRDISVDGRVYRAARKRIGLWLTDESGLADRCLNQLHRVHLLAASVAAEHAAGTRTLVLSLATDEESPQVVSAYRATLKEPDSLTHVPLERFLDVMTATAENDHQRQIVEDLCLRYVRFDLSG